MNKKNNLFKDLGIKEKKCEKNTALDINIEKIKHKVNQKIPFAYTERKSKIMIAKKKISLIAIAATFILGATAFASSGIVKTWFGSSSSTPDYTSLPTAQEVKKGIGYDVVLIDCFENGYKFDNGSIVKNKMADENGSTLEKFNSVDFKYEKDGDKVYFAQDKYNSETNQEGEIIANKNNIDIYYHSYTNKLVPPDYELTDEDKKAQENGELVFSYGSSKVEVNKVQSVNWEKDGMHYLLMQIDGKLTSEELTDMAKEVIEK